jgi:putative flippase GtrA
MIELKRASAVLFIKYVCVGLLNTAIHWAVFIFIYYGITDRQIICNGIAFFVAVTASFFINSRWTFKAQPTGGRYLIFILFMGALALVVGGSSDSLALNPLMTLIVFSAISLVAGFLFSKFIVFKDRSL